MTESRPGGGGNKRLEAAEAEQALSRVRGFLKERDEAVQDYSVPFSHDEIGMWAVSHGHLLAPSKLLAQAYLEECVDDGLVDLVRRGLYRATAVGIDLFWQNERDL